MSKKTVTYTVQVDVPRSHLWKVLADLGQVSNISPGVKASHLTSDQKVGVGATRHCDLTLFGASLEERVATWEEEELLEIDIYEVKRIPIVKDQRAIFALADEGANSRLTATFQYRVGVGPVGKVMHSLLLRSQLDSGWRQFVAGIKLHAETGQNVDEKTIVPESAATLVRT